MDEAPQLRKCLRDLLGLLGLPALWSSSDPRQTLRMLAETLVEVLALEACAVESRLVEGQIPLSVLYAEGEQVHPAKAFEWQAFVSARLSSPGELSRAEESTPIGTLHVARFSLGFYGGEGRIVVAARRPDFPSSTELVLLRSAASLAASGLRGARLVHEREQALRAKDEFLAMLGHELRNPLAPIVAALDLIKLREDGLLSPEYALIDRQVEHLRRLVEDLLDVTRISSGKAELQRQLLDINTVVEAAVEAARPLINQREHLITYDVPEGSLWVLGDSLRLTQVLGNLIINAAKYTERGGRIEVSARAEAQEILLEVRDNGAGIDAELLPHAFELFEQGRVSIDRSRGGLGIGLAIVKSLVALHGGSVSAQSDGVGCGSVFTVRLPTAPSSARVTGGDATPVALAHSRASRGVQILMVDDNRVGIDLLAELLGEYGYEVHVRYDPLEALAACEEITPRIVFVDIGLPIMDGYELARRIHAHFADNPPTIIAMTGYGKPDDGQRSVDSNIHLHLTKPVRAVTLVEHIESVLRLQKPDK